MIGFFEHQYLKFKKSHLHNLIALAKSDGKLHDDEEKLIYKIGEKYGLKDRQIASLIVSTKKRELYIPENYEGKMNQIYDLLMMVHADNIVDDNEIKFCENVAERFGFRKEIVGWMLDHFPERKIPDATEWDEIVENSKQFRTDN